MEVVIRGSRVAFKSIRKGAIELHRCLFGINLLLGAAECLLHSATFFHSVCLFFFHFTASFLGQSLNECQRWNELSFAYMISDGISCANIEEILAETSVLCLVLGSLRVGDGMLIRNRHVLHGRISGIVMRGLELRSRSSHKRWLTVGWRIGRRSRNISSLNEVRVYGLELGGLVVGSVFGWECWLAALSIRCRCNQICIWADSLVGIVCLSAT